MNSPNLAAQDVPRIFDDPCIERLAKLVKLLPKVTLEKFGKAIRTDVALYIRDLNTISTNDMRRQIEALFLAADRHQFQKAAKLIEALSEQTRAFVNKRAGRSTVGLVIPEPEAFRDPETREAACATVRSLLCAGLDPKQGIRLKKDGKRSTKLVPRLYLPGLSDDLMTKKQLKAKKKARPPKRAAERAVLQRLRMTFYQATGQEPPSTVNREFPSPFGLLAAECFKLIGIERPRAKVSRWMDELQQENIAVKKARRRRKRR